MAARTVDVIAAGPAAPGPFAPAAPAWSIARAFAQRGDSVRVLFPGPEAEARSPDGVAAVAVPLALRRPGALLEEADYAAAAGRRVRPEVDLVLRDPLGLGPLGVRHGRGARGTIVAIARSTALGEYDDERAARPRAGLADRVDGWRDRRAVRRLERAALEEASVVFVDAPTVAETLAREYSVSADRLRPTVPPVPVLPEVPTRLAARGSLGIPPDVPVVVAPLSPETPEGAGLPVLLEAFRRVRPLFPGIRLVVVGAEASTEPGLVDVPGRDATSYATALAAGDVALVAPTTVGFDPAAVLAQRLGLPTIAGVSVRFPVPPGPAVRTPPTSDAGDLASVLAELLADPAEARELATAGREYARAFDPERIVSEIGAAVGEPR